MCKSTCLSFNSKFNDFGYPCRVNKDSKDFLKISTPSKSSLQTRKSEKWRAYPHDILPMPFAVMDYDLAQPIKDALINLVEASDAGYLGKFPELGESLSAFAKYKWGWDLDPADVKICPDVGVGVIEVCRQIVKPGDFIMINTPVYFNFINWINELQCKAFDVPLIENELSYSLNFKEIEDGYASGVKVHILCNPHNPVGAVFPKDDLARLADLAARYGVVIAADEIHAPLVFAETKFTPFLTSSQIARKVGIAFLSATKSWNIAGLKCAQIVAVEDNTRKLIKQIPNAVHSRASLFGAVASSTAYRECGDWLNSLVNQLDKSRYYLADQLARLDESIGYKVPSAGYFGWLDMRKLELRHAIHGQNELADLLLSQGRLAVAPGKLYGPGGVGFIRINFATSFEILDDALNRIGSTIKTL
jgi:cystathionine beta-lyase